LIAELNDKLTKDKMKTYADKRRHAITSNFRVGDRVIYHQFNSKKKNKYKNQFSNISYIIKAVKGSMITVIDSNNNELTLNSSFYSFNQTNDEKDDIPTRVTNNNNTINQNVQQHNIETIIQNDKKINNHPQQQQQPNKITTIDDINNTNNNQQHTITIITTIIIREYKQPRDQYGRVEINNLGVTMIS
jgi:hypothetical protein